MYLRIGERRFHYDLLGRASDPLVCMTHSLAADGSMWAEQVPELLAKGFRVLRLDMRGHGGSDPVPGDYSFDDLGGDVIAVLSALRTGPVHFIGLSIGGMIGQWLGIHHPEHFRSLLLADTLPGTVSAAAASWDERKATVRAARSLEPLANGTLDRWFTPAFATAHPQRWHEIREGVIATSVAGYLGCAAAIQNFDFTARLPEVRLPTLVVCGADDQGTPPEQNRRIAELVPGGRYAEIADARHLPNIERADAFNRVMLDWLAAQR